MMKNKARHMSAIIAATAVLMLAMVIVLTGCSGGTSGSSNASNVPNDTKSDAKTVIKAASNVFAVTESLDLTDADSPATISSDDSRFQAFFDELKAYKTMDGVDLQDCSFTVKIQAVTASTARGDSTQTNYRYTITGADMTVNGKSISYTEQDGITTK